MTRNKLSFGYSGEQDETLKSWTPKLRNLSSRLIASETAVDALETAVDALESQKNDYSTTEAETNDTWNGAPVYRKIYSFGALPNTTTKPLAHGLTGVAYYKTISAIAYAVSGVFIPIPFSSGLLVNNVELFLSNTHINIKTYANFTAYTKCFVTLEWVKT